MFPNSPGSYSTAKPMLVNEATMLSTSCLVLGVTLLVGSRWDRHSTYKAGPHGFGSPFFFSPWPVQSHIDNIELECQLLFDTWNA